MKRMAEMNKKENELEEKIKKIKKFWDEKAVTFKTEPNATLGDPILKDIEVREIVKFIRNGQRVLDCGCGNGTSSLQIAQRRTISLIGLDYSDAMIEMARLNLGKIKAALKSDVRFEPGDILNLPYEKETFDAVITTRCLQNLPSFELQKKAILSIKHILRIGGLFLMLECSNDGLQQLNKILKWIGREPQSLPWHNLFFNDDELFKLSSDEQFPLVKVVNVSGVYHFFATCINYRLRRIAKILPPFFNTGYHKLYIWEKRS